jgi:tRNA (5-methylaminomethyl-2-thiouridylate)-methyltransferase
MKIAVLVSGGVDSSVALKLLQEQGHEIVAFYLKIWLEDELAYLGNCPWQEDLAYVEALCQQLNVPLQVISLQKEYWDRVVSYTISNVKQGLTPNPDIMCNQHVKFGAFFDHIDATFDKVATGHYAQIFERDGVHELHRSPDEIKDQTYFLSQLSEKQLARALFPIGHLPKEEVRALAVQYDLPTKARKDSQGICFLGKLKFTDFLEHHMGTKIGTLVEYETGKIVGQHQGSWFYTIGQRQGLGLAGGPWYVVSKKTDENIVYISRDYYAQDKERSVFRVGPINWLGPSTHKQSLVVKLRHGKHLHACTVDWDADGTATVTLHERDQGIAPGQFAVFYDGTRCVGSGVILADL